MRNIGFWSVILDILQMGCSGSTTYSDADLDAEADAPNTNSCNESEGCVRVEEHMLDSFPNVPYARARRCDERFYTDVTDLVECYYQGVDLNEDGSYTEPDDLFPVCPNFLYSPYSPQNRFFQCSPLLFVSTSDDNVFDDELLTSPSMETAADGITVGDHAGALLVSVTETPDIEEAALSTLFENVVSSEADYWPIVEDWPPETSNAFFLGINASVGDAHSEPTMLGVFCLCQNMGQVEE